MVGFLPPHYKGKPAERQPSERQATGNRNGNGGEANVNLHGLHR